MPTAKAKFNLAGKETYLHVKGLQGSKTCIKLTNISIVKTIQVKNLIKSFLYLNNVNSNEFNLGKEQELIEKLLKNYNKKLRPSGTLNVKFALNLNQIINLIEKDQIIVLNAFIDHEWVDKRLSWGKYFLKIFKLFNSIHQLFFNIDPEEYGNITLIRISGDQIWTSVNYLIKK